MESNLLYAPKQKFLLSKKIIPSFELNPNTEDDYDNDDNNLKDEYENDEILFNDNKNVISLKDSLAKISISSNETEEDSNIEINNNNSFEEEIKPRSILSLLIEK